MNTRHAPSGPIGFTRPDAAPGALSARDAAAILGAVGDVTLVVDAAGTIIDMAVADPELARYGVESWLGAAWADTVTIESRPKIAEMLAGESAAGRWRQINHVTANGEVPVRYLAISIGDGQRRIAIGRDMRAVAATQQRLLQTQQSMERDYIRLRQAEARYRMLFDMAQEAVVIVDARTRRIVEANPAVHRMIGAKDGTLVNQPVASLIAASERESLVAHLGAAEAVDEAPPVTLRLVRGAQEVQVSARLFRQARAALLLIRLVPATRPVESASNGDLRLAAIVERMPDAFVLADRRLMVIAANAAFLELAGVASIDRVRGLPLATWLGRPGIDIESIESQLGEHGTVRNVATILRGAGGGREEVEVSAVAADDGDIGRHYGFTIRDVGRRLRAIPEPGLDLPRSVDQLTELVGRMSLKEIVRESTDLIERLCIEAALVYTDDNRASAAEILGVSRQSLYSKLHRHGLGSLTAGDE